MDEENAFQLSSGIVFFGSILISKKAPGKTLSPRELSHKLKNWIGKDAKVITNKSNDIIILSKDGNRRIRFDYNNPSPHKSPHSHIEEYKNGKWVKSGPLYPSDVPQE